MVVAASFHLSDESFVPAMQGRAVALPAKGFRVARVAGLFPDAKPVDHRPDRMKLAVFAQQVFTAEGTRRYLIPDSH